MAFLDIDESINCFYDPDLKEEEFTLLVKVKHIRKTVVNQDPITGADIRREADFIFLIPQLNQHLERFYSAWFPRNTVAIEGELLFFHKMSSSPFRVYMSLATKDCPERHLGVMSMDMFDFFKQERFKDTLFKKGDKIEIISVKNSDEQSGKYGSI